MYVSHLHIENYKGIDTLDLSFNPGVNVLIGKNNSCKSAVIDILRLCLANKDTESRRDIWFDKSKDFHISFPEGKPVKSKETIISIAFKFNKDEIPEGEDPDEFELNHTAPYYHLASFDTDGQLVFKISFSYYLQTVAGDGEKLKIDSWVGEDKQQPVPPEVWDYFYVVYLQPLRDAAAALQPPYSKLGEHFEFITESKEEREGLASEIHQKMASVDGWKVLTAKGIENINEKHYKNLCDTAADSELEIGFLPFDFKRIANQLRIRLPYGKKEERQNEDFFEIDQNGLGYNNLIYASTVLANIENRKVPSATSLLLIEEPEAHLHPQLQNQFFEYMNTLSGRGYQIFLTSHSPTITAKANLSNVIVLHGENHQSTACHVADLDLGDSKDFLHKFLDVTKSQLFFANGVIFVEGYSEALCLEVFAKRIGIDLVKCGVEVVNIEGVSFMHFIKLFEQSKGLKSRFAVITDQDTDKKNGEGRLDSLKSTFEGKPNGFLAISEKENFESELYDCENNRTLIENIWQTLRPRVGTQEVQNFKGNPTEYSKKVDISGLKTDMAFTIADKLSKDSTLQFDIPLYIQKAIRFVITGNADTTTQ